MKTIKVSEATGPVLDWLVAKCEGVVDRDGNPKVFRWTGSGRLSIRQEPYADTGYYHPSSDWAQGGPIIERQEIELHKWAIDGWKAVDTNYQFLDTPQEHSVFAEAYGPTPLVAAMRSYVVCKLGETVEVPEELLP